ncbi:hypothetical protein LguiB_016892 [Lonicera macranthoides]
MGAQQRRPLIAAPHHRAQPPFGNGRGAFACVMLLGESPFIGPMGYSFEGSPKTAIILNANSNYNELLNKIYLCDEIG